MLIPDNVRSTLDRHLRGRRPNPDVIFTRLGEQLVLFHAGTDRFFELNRTAARLWELFTAGCDSAGIREQMLQEFAVDPDRLASEIEDLLTALRQEDLVSDGE